MVESDLKLLGFVPGSSELQRLTKMVDDSSYSLAEWIEALKEFQEWMLEQKRVYKAIPALEYLHCCSLSTSSHVIREPLWKVVSQMLSDFGFEDRKQSC